MVALKRAPSAATDFSTIAETMKEISTPRIVTVCAPRRPMVLPKKPAMIEPASGASGTHSSVDGESVADMIVLLLTLELVELVDVDRRAVAEQHDQDREADRRLGSGDREDEEDEDLPGHLVGDHRQEVRERDEVQVHREQHQLDAHQQHDEVLAVQKDANHRQREQDRAERQVVAERDGAEAHALSPPGAAGGAAGNSIVGFIFTMRSRSALRALSCSAGLRYFVSLRLRNVSAIAAMLATSSSTAAICSGYRYLV